MKLRDIILTANGNLRKSKLRAFLTSSAVFIGALTLMLTTGVGYGLRNYVAEQVNAAGAKDALVLTALQENSNPLRNTGADEYNPDSASTETGFGKITTLTTKQLQDVKDTPHILSVTPVYANAVEYITTGNKKYVASVTQAIDGLNIPLSAGRNVGANTSNYEVTLTPALIEPLGFSSAQDAVNKNVQLAFKDLRGQIFTLEATIVGVQEKTLIQANATTISLAMARDAFMKSTAGVPDAQRLQYFTAIAKYDNSISEQQLSDLKSKLASQHIEAKTLEDQLGVINTVINAITTFLNIFAGIALAAASFGIVNTLLMAVQERTREIGLMKALGMSKRKIFMLFSLEAVLIGLWSGLLALAAANLIGRIGSHYAAQTIFKDFEGLILFSFPALPMLVIVIVVMLIAFIAATLPARRAARLNPIDALRYE